MKKIFGIGIGILLFGILYIYTQSPGNQWNLSSQFFGPSVYLTGFPGVAYPEGTPLNTEAALVTPEGFTLNRSLMNPTGTYQGYFASNEGGERYWVRIAAFKRGTENLSRDAYVAKMVWSSNKNPLDTQLSVYNGAHVIMQNGIFSNFVPHPTTNILWMTNFGYVNIFQDNVGAKYTIADLEKINWSKIHNDLLMLADAYIKKYPPVSASEYTKFGPKSTTAMVNIDLTKLPEVTKK